MLIQIIPITLAIICKAINVLELNTFTIRRVLKQ